MNDNKKDLKERTVQFSINIINLCKSIKYGMISLKIIDQLIRSATSIGANYMEAINASSRRDFKNKIFICKKEAQETKYWLTLLQECESEKKDEIANLSQECHEFNLIFQKIISTIASKEIEK